MGALLGEPLEAPFINASGGNVLTIATSGVSAGHPRSGSKSRPAFVQDVFERPAAGVSELRARNGSSAAAVSTAQESRGSGPTRTMRIDKPGDGPRRSLESERAGGTALRCRGAVNNPPSREQG